MKALILTFILFFFSLGISAQTKLIVYSEDNSIFSARLNQDNLANEVSHFFEFININIESVVLKIVLENNQKLKKTINLEEGKQNIYSISNDGEFYEIQYRGNYNLNEDLPDFEFTKDLVNNPGLIVDFSLIQKEKEEEVEEVENEIDRTPSKLVNINLIIESIEDITDDKKKTKIIIEELNKGKYNCRQLKFLFTKIKTDYSRLYTFKSTVNSCLDKENLSTLKNSFKSKKYQQDFMKLVSTL